MPKSQLLLNSHLSYEIDSIFQNPTCSLLFGNAASKHASEGLHARRRAYLWAKNCFLDHALCFDILYNEPDDTYIIRQLFKRWDVPRGKPCSGSDVPIEYNCLQVCPRRLQLFSEEELMVESDRFESTWAAQETNLCLAETCWFSITFPIFSRLVEYTARALVVPAIRLYQPALAWQTTRSFQISYKRPVSHNFKSNTWNVILASRML